MWKGLQKVNQRELGVPVMIESRVAKMGSGDVGVEGDIPMWHPEP